MSDNMVIEKEPLVSILLPVFNSEKTLERAILSVISQSYQNWELIISDNASTDNSFDIITKFACKDERLRVSRNETNLGPLVNYNLCIQQSRGEFIELFGSDDAFDPRCIEVLVRGLQAWPNANIATCAKQIVNSSQIVECVSRPHQATMCVSGSKVVRQFVRTLTNEYMSPVMFRSKVKSTGFSDKFFLYSDVDYWCSMLSSGDLLYVDEVLFAYSRRSDSGTIASLSDMSFGSDLIKMWAKYWEFLDDDSKDFGVFENTVREKCLQILNYSKEQDPRAFEWVFDLSGEQLPFTLRKHGIALDDQLVTNLLRLIYFGFNYAGELQQAKQVIESETGRTLDWLYQENLSLKTELDLLRKSRSWKITAPLRGVTKKLGWLRR